MKTTQCLALACYVFGAAALHAQPGLPPEAAHKLFEGKMDDSKSEIKAMCEKLKKQTKAYPFISTCKKKPDGTDDESGCIPINLCDDTREVWKVRWDQITQEEVDSLPDKTKDDAQFKRRVKHLRGEDRRPGPVNVSRHPVEFGYQGVSTFFGLPVALTPEDLEVGEVDVAIMGAPLDTSLGMRGGAFGPKAVRSSARYLPTGLGANAHMHVLVNPFQTLRIVDYGDASIDPMSTHRSLKAIRELVKSIASAKFPEAQLPVTGVSVKQRTIPVIVGGDHSLEYSNVSGLADVYGKGNVGVVHFDAHYDATKAFMGHHMTHGMPVFRLINEGHVKGENYIQVGLRGYYPGEGGFDFMRKHKMRYHTLAEIERDGWNVVMPKILKEALDGPEYLFLSIDIDTLDPAYAPGTGTPEPGGLTPRELFPLIRGLCTHEQLVGFDLVELNPLADPGYTTALAANRILRECLTGIAMRREGGEKAKPRYLHEKTTNWQPKE